MSKARILIVEDEGVIAADIEERLKRLGYEIAGWANNGDDAIMYAISYNPDLILMDIMLKGPLDGIEVAGQVRRQQDVPIIFLTAFSDEAMLERAKITEPFGYLLKPFNERELVTTIEMALYKHQMDRKCARLLGELQQAWQEVKILSGLLPICMHCKMIRDNEDHWHDVVVYVRQHSEAKFSHSVCPDCLHKYYPEVLDEN
jgi:DNA-binding response OmpR family regulator